MKLTSQHMKMARALSVALIATVSLGACASYKNEFATINSRLDQLDVKVQGAAQSAESANQSLIRDPALLDRGAASFASYPGGHNEGFPDTFKQLYRAVYEDIRRGQPAAEPLYATFQDGHRELLLCEAVLDSHRRGGWVTVPNA